jgi:hypothetical protein
LGKHQIERLAAIRKAASQSWDLHAQNQRLTTDFTSLFQEVLALFDGEPHTFHVQRVQDELVGQMSELLSVNYDALALELVDAEARQRVLNREQAPTVTSAETRLPAPAPQTDSPRKSAVSAEEQPPPLQRAAAANEVTTTRRPHVDQARTPTPPENSPPSLRDPPPASTEQLQAHIVSPVDTTDRLQAIQKTIAEATGEAVPDFQANVVRAIPVQAGGLYPISDVWYVEPALDVPDRLRVHIAQLAREIAQEAELADRIESVVDGIGFVCNAVAAPRPKEPMLSTFQRGVLTLLHALSAPYVPGHRSAIDGVRLADDIALLLQGAALSRRGTPPSTRLGDAGLVKLFRLIRLARRILELEAAPSSPANGASG